MKTLSRCEYLMYVHDGYRMNLTTNQHTIDLREDIGEGGIPIPSPKNTPLKIYNVKGAGQIREGRVVEHL